MSRPTPRVLARSMSSPKPQWTVEILKYDPTIDEYYGEKRGSYWWPWRRDAFDKCLKEHYDPKILPIVPVRPFGTVTTENPTNGGGKSVSMYPTSQTTLFVKGNGPLFKIVLAWKFLKTKLCLIHLTYGPAWVDLFNCQ
jgi:hypothetical protein